MGHLLSRRTGCTTPEYASFALQKTVDAYANRKLQTNLIDKTILEAIYRSLAHLTYVDDQHESSNADQIFQFFWDLKAIGTDNTHFKLDLGDKEDYNGFTMYDPKATGISNLFKIANTYLNSKTRRLGKSLETNETFHKLMEKMT